MVSSTSWYALTIVLYSSKDSNWKVADFGLTTTGNSTHDRTTVLRRGSPGYRAPELLREVSKYNNKVDIWAMGCIMYELASGQKAFGSDDGVRYLSPDDIIVDPSVLDDEFDDDE